MKFSCAKDNLGKAIAAAERFTGKNITLPILGNVLLEASGNTLTVTATNLEYAIQISVGGKGEKPGKATVPAKILNSLLQSIRDERVELEEKQSNLNVHTDTVTARINGMNADEFPLLPKIKKDHTLQSDSSALRQGLERVLPAVSASEFKPELTGVYFQIEARTMRLVATDTFRLAEKTIPLEERAEQPFSFILPQRVALELARISADKDEVMITVGDNQALFEADGARIISRLIEGNFPEYGGIIPKQFEASSFLKREEVASAIRSSSIFSSRIQEVILNFREKLLEINSNNTEIGEQKISLPASTTGNEIKISFNYRYLLDGVMSIDEDELFIGVNNENAPSLLRGKSDNSFLYVLMPIRLT